MEERLLTELARGSALEPFRTLVEPLEKYDWERRSDLVRTLRVCFAAGANASEAADRLLLRAATAYSTVWYTQRSWLV